VNHNDFSYGLWWIMLTYPEYRVVISDWRQFGDATQALSRVFTGALPRLSFTALSSSAYIAMQNKSSVMVLNGDQLRCYDTEKACTSLPSTVMVPYDTHMEPIASTAFPRLSPCFRQVHTQLFKDVVMCLLSCGKHVVFYHQQTSTVTATISSKQQTLLDLFATIPTLFKSDIVTPSVATTTTTVAATAPLTPPQTPRRLQPDTPPTPVIPVTP